MTTQKTFKRRVRARMAKTGESYTAARRMLIAGGDQPDPGTPTYEPLLADDRMVEATGRTHDEWFVLIDARGRPEHLHPEVVEWLMAEHEVTGWWAQSITVSYERAKGLRGVGQRANGWSVTASKTVNVPVETLFDAWEDLAVRQRWLPDADLVTRTSTRPKSARYDWEDGATRVIAGFEPKGPHKAVVSLEHERLPDADTADEMRPYWRAALVDLKALLEAGPADSPG